MWAAPPDGHETSEVEACSYLGDLRDLSLVFGVVLELCVWGCGGSLMAVAFLEPRAAAT